MFSGLRNKATAIVKSLDPAEHIKFLSKQTTDDPSVLNQNLRDVIRHLGDGPLHDRADQALGCMIAAHASRQLSTIWTVLLQMLREALDSTRAQLSILVHFSHIANRIAIPQRANAFRVFAKEIMTVCGSQDIVGDRQFPAACNTILAALGVHADADLARALMEKLLAGLFSWPRTDSRRAACSICSTLIFGTTGCDSFGTTITNLRSSQRPLLGTALLVDSCLSPLLDEAVRLSAGSDPTRYPSIVEASEWVAAELLAQLAEGAMEPMVLPVLASCYSRLHAFAAEHHQQQQQQQQASSSNNKGSLLVTPAIMRSDGAIRQRAVAILARSGEVRKILWCPIISLLQHCGLSADAAEASEEMVLLQRLAECEDSMARCEALVAMARAVEDGVLSSRGSAIDALVARTVASHRRHAAERCGLTVRGALRLVGACFGRLSSGEAAREVLHTILRAHVDMSNNLNTMPALQLEVLALVEHTVSHPSTAGAGAGDALAYALMALQRGEAKVRARAVRVLVRLCEEASLDTAQLMEPTLRSVDFIEGAAAAASPSAARDISSSNSLDKNGISGGGGEGAASSGLLRVARNYDAVLGYLFHLLAAGSYDTPKEENAMVQTLAEALRHIVAASSQALAPLYRPQPPVPAEDAGTAALAEAAAGGAPLEHTVLAILGALFNCVHGATPYPIDTAVIVLESMVAAVDALAGGATTQFDIHLHKRLFSFAWNILVLCCSSIDAVSAPRLAQDASLYTGVIPPHPLMSVLVEAAGKTAMSSSAYSQSSAFFSLIRQCTRLLEGLLRWGHRSPICVAHLRVQFQQFLSVMDVIVAVQPVEALRCSQRLLLTILTRPSDPRRPREMVLSQKATAELCERAVASAIPILNRSLSFDLATVGADVFGFLEVMAELDAAAGWTVCYGAIDRSFQLFVRMVEMATDGAYYNTVAGPFVVPPIVRALTKVLHSPHRARAFKTFAPEMAEAEAALEPMGAAWEGEGDVATPQPPINRFPAFAQIAALVREAHERLQCRAFADVEALIEGRVPCLLGASPSALEGGAAESGDESGAPNSPSIAARHREVMRWLKTTSNADLLARFVKGLGRAVRAIGGAEESSSSSFSSSLVRGYVFEQSVFIGAAAAGGGVNAGPVRAACDAVADGLIALYEQEVATAAEQRHPPITYVLCAAALRGSLLPRALQHVVTLCATAITSSPTEASPCVGGDASVMATADVAALATLIESPSADLDTIVLTLPAAGGFAALAPETGGAGRFARQCTLVLRCLLTVLPATVQWVFGTDHLAALAQSEALAPLLLPFTAVAVRQSISIPSTPAFLYSAEVWGLLAALFPNSPIAVFAGQSAECMEVEGGATKASSSSTVDWSLVGAAIRSLVAPSTLLADVRTIALCVAETLFPKTHSHIDALAPAEPLADGSELQQEYLRYYLTSLVLVDDEAEAADGSDGSDGLSEEELSSSGEAPVLEEAAAIALVRSMPFCGRQLLSFPPSSLTADDIAEMALVCRGRADGARLARALLALCATAPKTVTHRCLITVVCALVRCEVTTEDFNTNLATNNVSSNGDKVEGASKQSHANNIIALLRVLAGFAAATADYASSTLGRDERLALRYAVMYMLVLACPEEGGQWELAIERAGGDVDGDKKDTDSADDSPRSCRRRLYDLAPAAATVVAPLVVRTLAAVLELPPQEGAGSEEEEVSEGASNKASAQTPSQIMAAVARAVLSIFVRSSSLLLGGINESIMWLVVKCCPAAIWACIVSRELFSDTEVGVLHFVLKMSQTVGVGPELVLELHARYTPLLLSYGAARELDADEQHMALWVTTSVLLHMVGSEERHTKPRPHMSLADSLPLYNDFPLAQMASPVVGVVRSAVDELLFPVAARLSIPTSERHWNIHARGHLLPVLGRRVLGRADAGKIFSSILHMYLHVVNNVFSSLQTLGPSAVSDVFASLGVLASGNASLLKHSPAADGTIASNILQRLFGWYAKYAADTVSSVDKSHSAVDFGTSLFPEPTASFDFCDSVNILTCATVISSLFVRGNELLPGAVDVGFILDRMLSMDLVSHQSALTAIVVMSGSATRREMSSVAPMLTQRLLRELDRCVRGSLSYSFGIMQMLRTAFSILSAFPDDAVTMKVCEAVWNVVVNEASGGRRVQHYAHFMLQSIVNLHTVSATQWGILRAIVSLPNEAEGGAAAAAAAAAASSRGGIGIGVGGSSSDLLGGSFAFANSLFSHDSNAGRFVETGRQFINELLSEPSASATSPPPSSAAGGASSASPPPQAGAASSPPPPTPPSPAPTTSASAAVASPSPPPEWGYHPVRTSIISVGLRRRARMSVAESEESSATVASAVYGTTPNLLQLTTIASFVLRSHEGGEGGLDEADRNRVTILDMLRQVDDDASAVGDTFLTITYALLEAVLDPRDAMFVLLNRFNFSASSRFLFTQSLRRAAAVAGAHGEAFPTSDAALYVDAAGRRYVSSEGAWWVACSALSAVVRWLAAGGQLEVPAEVEAKDGEAASEARSEPLVSFTGADVPLGLVVASPPLRGLCAHYVGVIGTVVAHEEAANNAAGAAALRAVVAEVLAAASGAAAQQEGQQEGGGAAFRAVVADLQAMVGRALK